VDVERLIVGQLATNCYLVRCSEDGEAVVIDPGGEGEKIWSVIQNRGLNVRLIINTHGHGDHIAANGFLKAKTGAEVLIHPEDASMLTSPARNLSAWINGGLVCPPADRLIKGDDEVTCGNVTFKVLATPGHTPGGISLWADGVVFTGDTLFRGSIGRTDFPGGDYRLLLNSIRDKLLVLPSNTIVYPGHGPESNIGEERVTNPFLI
jgi:hydroxyacylglutathione hydrolase